MDNFLEQIKSYRKRTQFYITVRRSNIEGTCLESLMNADPEKILMQPQVTFKGEVGADYGGLFRELVSLLAKRIFAPEYGLWQVTDRQELMPSPSAVKTSEPRMWFWLMGRTMALSLMNNAPLGVPLSRVFFKALLEEPLTIDDLREVDQDLHSSLTNMLSVPLCPAATTHLLKACYGETSVDDLDLFFVKEIDMFGEVITVDLIDGGSKIRVTDEDKEEFVKLYITYSLKDIHKWYLDGLREKLVQIIPWTLLKTLKAEALKVLVCGVADLNVSEWKEHTEYEHYTASDSVIRSFWECVESWPVKDQVQLLQFATGASAAPIGGFSALTPPFKIARVIGPSKLPMARTCTNTLYLPDYPDDQILKAKLSNAIQLAEGFDFQ